MAYLPSRVILLFFTLLCSVAQACEISTADVSPKKENKTIKSSFVKLWPGLILSGAVGAITGGITGYLENRFAPVGLIVWILGWLLESEIRHQSIIALQHDLDDHQIEYKGNLMFGCARLASWLVYLQVLGSSGKFHFSLERRSR